MILPRSEIPEWFINQSSGSEITLQLPQHCCQILIGFALCVILETSAWTGDGFHVGCEYSFEMNTLSERKYVGRCCYFGCYSNKLSDQVMLGFSPLGNVGFSDDNHHTTVSFKFSSDSQLVVRCGMCPVNVMPTTPSPTVLLSNLLPKFGNWMIWQEVLELLQVNLNRVLTKTN